MVVGAKGLGLGLMCSGRAEAAASGRTMHTGAPVATAGPTRRDRCWTWTLFSLFSLNKVLSES